MTTIKEIFLGKDEQGVEGRESEVILKKGRETIILHNRGFVERIKAAYGISRDSKELELSLKEYKENISEIARGYLEENGTLRFIVDGIVCSVTFGNECVIKEEHVDEVKKLLGDRFPDLVRTKIKYEGTMKLIELAAGDRGKEIAKHLIVKEKSPSIRFELEEIKKDVA